MINEDGSIKYLANKKAGFIFNRPGFFMENFYCNVVIKNIEYDMIYYAKNKERS